MPTPTGDNGSPTATSPVADSFDSANLVWADDEPETGTASDADSQSAATPESAPASVTPPEAATELPAAANTDGAAQGTGQEDRGPIPFERHKAILENERQRAARLAWAQDLADAGITDSAKIKQALQLYDGVDGDPLGFIERYIEIIKRNPDLAEAATAMLGRVAGASGAARAAATDHGAGDDPEPQADLENRESGEAVYSPAQQKKWQEWSRRQAAREADARLDQRLAERLGPVEQDLQRRQRQEEIREFVGEQQTAVQREYEQVKDLPLFQEHKDAIKAFMASKEYKCSMVDAYLHVLKTAIVPSLEKKGEDGLMARLRGQQAASSASPSAAATASVPSNPKGFHDKSLTW